ncbi:hypothetical protein BUALT_Bualt05G0159400 [Buddleja alternifolia]|uniref:Gnk2-homologous domain-containing protein n=1 Tax=Buddleja alternifolia TaxID=168488 RepID=A0AAV6XJL8_9LAMI|nr:hypothetical protein BUALT_Bualt05G0159400 [Buddleja alternifolia]
MKRAILVLSVTFIALVILLLPDVLFADPRSQTVEFSCGTNPEHNFSVFTRNFATNMDTILGQVQTSGFGIAVTGSGPDAHYGLAQCYGDLSLVDCVLCFSQGRTILPQCYPGTSGRIYLDGCFMRGENYSFFQEYTGPNDHAICGNITRNDSAFQESAKRAISQAVSAVPNNNGYARARVAVTQAANSPTYVLANCWRSINASSCRACLENASASISRCLPSSEGRALNTGCFMRYSDINFFNPIPGNGSSRVFCILCYAQARTVIPQCYPWNGGKTYLDGCFMRLENYSFFQEYTGPNNHAVYGNITRNDPAFQGSARRAISRAVSDAPNNNGYARAKVIVSRAVNDSVYVLANCWRTLSTSYCRACLENASTTISGCLPSSEGRALNTGCHEVLG